MNSLSDASSASTLPGNDSARSHSLSFSSLSVIGVRLTSWLSSYSAIILDSRLSEVGDRELAFVLA